MTKFMKLELKRLVTKLPEVDPTTSDYHVLLRSIEFLDGMGQTIEAILDEVLQPDEDGGAGESSAIELQPIPFPGATLDPTNPVPVPAPVEPPQEPAGSSSSSFPVNNSSSVSADSPEAEKEEKTWAASDVRAKLVEAKAKGVVVKALLKTFGVENFQELDQTKYAALMAALEQEVV